MKLFTRILSVVLIAVLALSLVACGGSDSKVYKVVADNSFAPFDFLDEETNTYTGVDMDILAAIAKDQGFDYEVDNCGWDAALGNLGSGQADAMIAGMTITEERKESYDFSDGYFTEGQIMLVKKDSTVTGLADLKGKTVAVKNGTMSHTYASSVAEQYGFEVVTYKDSLAVYAAVSGGINDAGFEDFSVISYQIKAQSLDLKTVGEAVNPGEYGFAVQKGKNAELIEMFNKGLANIKASGEYDKILAKYGM